MSSQQRKDGILFQSSLKSQDDYCIEYKAFEEEDYHRNAESIEKVIEE